jgi:hypothetical protein
MPKSATISSAMMMSTPPSSAMQQQQQPIKQHESYNATPSSNGDKYSALKELDDIFHSTATATSPSWSQQNGT